MSDSKYTPSIDEGKMIARLLLESLTLSNDILRVMFEAEVLHGEALANLKLIINSNDKQIKLAKRELS